MEADSTDQTHLIFDGNSLYARSYFAAANAGGDPLKLAMKTVLSLLRERTVFRPTHLLFCWDGERKNYKERSPKPSDYHPKRQDLIEALEMLLGAAHAEPQGEADDAVATAAYQSEKEGHTVIVASGDKDIQQVHGGRIHFYCLNKKTILSRREIIDKWGVKRPVQIPLALAIIGDKVDNIDGVPNFGPKKVAKIFESVTPQMSFSEAYETVRKLLPRQHRETFDDCLELTLLQPDIKGVPRPAPLAVAKSEALYNFNLDSLSGEFAHFYADHYGLDFEAMLEDELTL